MYFEGLGGNVVSVDFLGIMGHRVDHLGLACQELVFDARKKRV